MNACRSYGDEVVDKRVISVIIVCVCFWEKDQLCKMMWAKRPLTHNTPASAIIRLHRNRITRLTFQ